MVDMFATAGRLCLARSGIGRRRGETLMNRESEALVGLIEPYFIAITSDAAQSYMEAFPRRDA